MKAFKKLAALFVVYCCLAVTTIAADDSRTFSYEKGGATFSAELKDGKVVKLVRNKKVVYRSTRKLRQRSVMKQIKGLSRNLQQFVESGGGNNKALEEKIIAQINKITLRLSR